ncbi:MAG: response regulator [Firmicutes bacterium]|nr:response regulator [Bacillota bacterium]
MTYSIIGILAAIILLIINRDVIWNRNGKNMPVTLKNYRDFLLGVMLYYITDMLWGLLESYGFIEILYADTAVHFIAMAGAVMLWTRYVVSYLDDRKTFGRFLSYAGRLFFAFGIIVVVINFFYPIQFWFDEGGGYHAGPARYITLLIQIILFLLTSIYALRITARSVGAVRRRHLTIGLFGIAMILLIGIQIFYPLLPFYAMGYLLGTCVLHSFVVEDEKEEDRLGLEEAIEREKLQKAELNESREALKDALASAEQANKAKTAFLSNMSHEIRTPMNAIIGLNNIAMNEPTASEEVKGHLRKIGGSAQHLLGIINDILDMSRIESGRMAVRSEEFSFSKCLEQINTMIGGQCAEKGLAYECLTKGKIDEHYVGDAMKLKQVLINILGNAVKFTPEGGTVRFLIEEGPAYDQKKTLRFIISDTGIGMSQEYLPHLFEAFSQEDASSTSVYGSTGLGMPITKSIVELMNGEIQVESEKGKGTTFYVTITFGESRGKNIDIEDGEMLPHEMKALDEFREETNLEGRRILLAEDVQINAEIIMMILGMKKMEVDLAENGRIAVDIFRDHQSGYYDAILMDMRMPEMDGLEATRAIRAMDREDAGRIPIIALTANAFDEDVQQSMQAGLDAHLSKPVEPGVLYETLERLL